MHSQQVFLTLIEKERSSISIDCEKICFPYFANQHNRYLWQILIHLPATDPYRLKWGATISCAVFNIDTQGQITYILPHQNGVLINLYTIMTIWCNRKAVHMDELVAYWKPKIKKGMRGCAASSQMRYINATFSFSLSLLENRAGCESLRMDWHANDR